MSTATPNPGQPWQPAPQYQQPAPHYAQPAPQYAPQAAPQYTPPSNGSILHRWPTWAQNTALAVGAVAILVVVFFAGYFTAHAVDSHARPDFGTGQDFTPRQFGGNGGNGGNGGTGGNGGFGGQSGNGS